MSDNRLTQTEPSLNPATADMINIKINGLDVQVPKNENLIESAKRVGVDVPYFCYHPRLSKGDAANCRMCLVEVGMPGPDGTIRMMPKPQAACTMPAAEGMVVQTDTPKIVKDRKGVLEFLLINHPLDCPICDRGGECPLQNNTLFYGPPTSRYIEEKRHYPKAYPISEHVVFDRERCIHCARCTRFTEDISGDAQLGFLKRGADMEVNTFADTEYRSKFSGNVIELCPVGALLSKSYRFKARPWDLHSQKSVCSKCSNGCNIKIDYRQDKIQRINARINEDVNEEWTCDRGKFGHDYVSSDNRLKTPMLKQNGEWMPISWTQAYALLAEKLKAAGSNSAGIGGAHLTNEDNFQFQKLFRKTLGSSNLDSRTDRVHGSETTLLSDRFGYHGMGNSIAQLQSFKSYLIVGSALADELPIIFLRVRKAYRFHGASVVSAISKKDSSSPNVGDFATVEMIYRPGTEIALLNGILNILFNENLLPSNPGVDLKGLQQSVSDWTPAKVEQETGVPAAHISEAAHILAAGTMALIAGKEIREHPHYETVVAALGNLMLATGNPENLNIPERVVNAQGAKDMGILPDLEPGYAPVAQLGKNAHEILESAAKGELQALWIAGEQILNTYHDKSLVRQALDQCPFVIVSELTMTETALLADLVLPAASFAEKDGTFTSCERRIQKIEKVFEISRDIKADWLIFSELAAMIDGSPIPFSAADIFTEIAAAITEYAGISYKSLGDGGVRWRSDSSSTNTKIFTAIYTPPAKN